jgi:hypothetical protein
MYGYLLGMQFFATPQVTHKQRTDLATAKIPTLCLSIDIKKDPKGAKWLFRRIESLKVANGRFDTVVHIVDESGDLVAFSKHVSLIYDKKGTRASVQGKKGSKL